jgi:outer membrane protein assembly factor BamB
VGEGIAVIGDIGGNVTAVGTATGEVAWTVALGGDITSSPAIVDGSVYIRNGEDALFALDAATGEERWSFATGGEGGYTLDTAPAVVDGVVYMTTIDSDRDESLFALNAETGEELWSFEPEIPGLFTPAVVAGVVYAAGPAGIHAVDAASGDLVWNAPVGDGFSALAVAEGAVVVHTRRDLVAVDRATGEQLWHYDTGGSWSAPTVVDGVVYVGSNGVAVRLGLHAVDLATGQRLWQIQPLGSTNTSPVVTGGVVYVGCRNGLYAFGSSGEDLVAGDETVITTMVGPLTFATAVDEDDMPVDPGSAFSSGATSLYIVYDFIGVEAATYRLVWTLDGASLYEGELAWERGEYGRALDWISSNAGPLPDGSYEVTLFLDGVEMRRGTATIGG